MAVIETNALTKRFGDEVLAVDDLDLRVEQGEVFGFLGPNGAGKSTTINMLLDFVRPTGGEASVLGHDVNDESDAVRRRVGVLPEGIELYDRLTAREHLQVAIRMKDAADDPEALLATVGLSDDADRKVSGFSKGMKQRLALGIALIGDPDLLILDEPSSGLDPQGIQDMRELIREQADQGTTVFFSSHILAEVEAVCDRVGIMNQGRLVAVDSIEALRESAGGTAEVRLDVHDMPDGLLETLRELDGVRNVGIEESESESGPESASVVQAKCEDGMAKMRVIRQVDQAATVTDVVAEDISLEELFNRFTQGGRTGRETGKQTTGGSEPEEVSA